MTVKWQMITLYVNYCSLITVFYFVYVITNDPMWNCMLKMAADRVVVDNVLCFLIARFGKTGNKQLKSATLDFYSFEDLYQAKQHLLSDVEQWKSDINLPHIPLRRDGEQRSAKSLDDIFLIMTCLDEHLTLKSLPKYVSDSPDSMPSLRIYDGDMKSLMLLFDNLKGRLDALEGAVAAILSNVNSLSTAVQSTVGVHL